MLSRQRRYLITLSVAFSIVPLAAAQTKQPTVEQIAQWIEQLGDNKFSIRQRASKQLWQAGIAAETALQQAKKSNDAEVARRARDILDKFQWGIYPDTPADIVAQVRAYQYAEDNERLKIFPKLLRGGLPGLAAAVKAVHNEKDSTQRQELKEMVSKALPSVWAPLRKDGEVQRFETLLEIGHQDGTINHNHYTAYWLLRGKLDERIADFRARIAKGPTEKRHAETLVYLYRAKDDLTAARKAAEKSERGDLLEGILYEMGDWKALAEWPASKKTRGVEDWAYRAAYARLAGKGKEFNAAVQELNNFALQETKPILVFTAAKALLLNGRIEDGLEALSPFSRYGTLRFEFLTAQMKYDEALNVVEEWRPAGSREQKELDILKARLLYLFGEKEKAHELFARLAAEITADSIEEAEMYTEENKTPWFVQLLNTEYNLDLKNLAFEHCVKVVDAGLGPSIVAEGVQATRYLKPVFPKQTEMIQVWWLLLRSKFAGETKSAILKRLRDLMEGKIAAKKVKAWIEQADRTLSASPEPISDDAPDAEKQRLAWAEAARLAGLNDLAVSLLEKAGTPKTLLRLGDLLAEKKKWTKAAERYRQAWDKSVALGAINPLPLYLAGDALVKAGRDKEGRKLIEQAHRAPLGDTTARYAFLRGLTQRHHADAMRREAKLLLHVSDPKTFFSGAAVRHLAFAAKARKDYLKAAAGFEKAMLRCLHTYTNFVGNSAYAVVPADIHFLRAKGLLAAGKFDEARKHFDLALSYSPGKIDVSIDLTAEMERRGRKKEASVLFERSYAIHDKWCRDYPRCARAHNVTAWLCACCRRRLDEALRHARKAVELAPDKAGYLDTLAEVHFQRGEKDKAVELGKRVVELDPKKPYYRKQLKRLQAGNPSAARPPEDDDGDE